MSKRIGNNRPGQLRAYLAIAWYSLRAQTRNPATFFFGFIFPLVFISIFGLIGGGAQKIHIGLIGHEKNSIVQQLQKNPSLAIETGEKDYLEKRLAIGKIAAIVYVKDPNQTYREMLENAKKNGITSIAYPHPDFFKLPYPVSVTQSSGMPQEAAIVTSLVTNIVDKTNLHLSNVTNPQVSLKVQKISGRQQRYIDFALPGQIGFALLSTALFGTVFGLIYLKRAGVLKRMFATPTKPLTILFAQGTSRLVVALVQTMMILLVGVLAFKFYLPHGLVTFLEITVLSAIGLIAFLGFGYFIAGLSNDENAAGPLTNLVTLPQFLLSGTFFSTENFPKWVQPVANNLPLSYFNMAIRKITTEGGTFNEAIPYMIGLLIWGAVMYILAARTFKWE